ERVRSLRLGGRPDEAARPRSAALPWAFCAVLLAATAAFGYAYFRLPRPGDAAPGPAGPSADVGKPAAVEPSDAPAAGDHHRGSRGYVVPAHKIQVSPTRGGRRVYAHERREEGRRFNEGDVLARIEDTDYKARRDKAAGLLAEAQATLGELEKS